MRVALELGLNLAAKRGIDAYYDGLVRGLAEAGAAQTTLFAYFFRDFDRKRALLPQDPRLGLDVRRWPQWLVRGLEGAGVPVVDNLFIRPGNFDVYHGVGWLPCRSSARTVVTVCDLLYEIYRERSIREGRTPEPIPAGLAAEVAQRADQVIAISECTKRDLVRFYGTDPERIHVTLLGVDHGLFRPAEDPEELERVRRTYHLPAAYALLLGPFEPRRNHERALEALSRLRAAGVGLDLGVVLAGTRNEYLSRLEGLIVRLGLGPAVKVLGYVPRSDLPALYQLATVFVHPTIYEGFGLPVLEAMACGAPIVTSKTSSIPEIVGEAAETVDPERLDELASALREVLLEPTRREELRRLGLARAAAFTWRRTAEQTLRVWESAAAHPCKDPSASRRT